MIDSWNSDWPLHILYFAQWRRQNSNIVFFNYFNSDIFMDADIIFSNPFKLREFFMEICLWKDIKRLRKQLSLCPKKRVLKIFVPSLIILTFILFTVIPNLIEAISYTENIPELKYYTRIIMYLIGWTLDPLIYIFPLKAIRRKL